MVVIDGINYLTVEEVCSKLHVKPATIYAYVSRGILQSYKQGIKRQRLYREDEIDRLLVIRPPEQAMTQVLEPAPATSSTTVLHEPEPPKTTPEFLPDARDWIAER